MLKKENPIKTYWKLTGNDFIKFSKMQRKVLIKIYNQTWKEKWDRELFVINPKIDFMSIFSD